MDKFVIRGGAPLRGKIAASGTKNSALPALAACLLTEEPVTLHRIPGCATSPAIRKFPPSIWGKVCTMVQAVTAAACMAGNVGDARVMLWLSAAFTVWSGIHYTWRTVQVARVH